MYEIYPSIALLPPSSLSDPPPMRTRTVVGTPPSTFFALEDVIACRFEDVTDQFSIGGSASYVSQGQDDTASVIMFWGR